MVSLYPKDIHKRAKRLKRKYLYIIIGCVVAFLTINTLIFLARHNIGRAFAAAINIIFSVLGLGVFLFIWNTKFKRVRKYAYLMRFFEKGIKEESRGVYAGYSDTIIEKDGLEFCSVLFENTNHKGIVEQRQVMIEADFERPKINIGDLVIYKALGGILTDYEIIKKDFED